MDQQHLRNAKSGIHQIHWQRHLYMSVPSFLFIKEAISLENSICHCMCVVILCYVLQTLELRSKSLGEDEIQSNISVYRE